MTMRRAPGTSSLRRLLAAAALLVAASAACAGNTHTVVLIVSDGLRWQEVFSGADPALLDEKNGGNWVAEVELRKRYWSDDVAERRRLLFPLLWGTVAARGQLFGNQTRGSIAAVTNGKAFSYPGYNEMTTGYPNDAIDRNEFGPNPHATVFEWLNADPELHGKVAVFGTWNVFDDIFNRARSRLIMQTGWAPPPKGAHDTPRDALLRDLYATTTQFDEEDAPNSFLQISLLDHVKASDTRALFVGYGETDNWAHQGRYDLVLDSAHRFDGFVRQLWDTMQSIPRYRGRTTFIVTTDHGRGGGLTEWKEHGVDEKGSENIWIAVIGPDTPALGERTGAKRVAQAQIAATVAAFLGRDYPQHEPHAAEPLLDVLPPR